MKTKILFLLLSIAFTGTHQATQKPVLITVPTLKDLSAEKIDQLLQSLYPNDYQDETRYQKIVKNLPISPAQQQLISNCYHRFEVKAAVLWANNYTDRTPLELLEYEYPNIIKQVAEKKIKWDFSFENLINAGGIQKLEQKHTNFFHLSLTSLKGLSRIPDFSKMTGVDLSNNLITEIYPYAFKELANIEELYFYENPIKVIHENAFYGLSRLKFLHFGDNLTAKIHPNAFNGLPDELKNKLEEKYLRP